jgi:phage gpG-like protein
MIRLKVLNIDELVPPDNPSPLMARIAALLKASIRKNFDDGGRPAKWKPLRGEARKPLKKSGALQDSLITYATENTAAVTAGENLPYNYGWTHETGALIPVTAASRRFFWMKWYETQDPKWKWMALSKQNTFSITARPFMMFQVDDIEKIEALVGSFYIDGPESIRQPYSPLPY